MAKVHFAEEPAQVNVYLRSGEKISTIIYIKNPDNIFRTELCEQYIQKLMDIFDRSNVGVAIGNMLIRTSDISAITAFPYTE